MKHPPALTDLQARFAALFEEYLLHARGVTLAELPLVIHTLEPIDTAHMVAWFLEHHGAEAAELIRCQVDIEAAGRAGKGARRG